VRDYEYLCGKIRAGEKKRFYEGDALDDLNREIAESDDPAGCSAAQVKEALGSGGFGLHEWFMAWQDVGVGCNDVSDHQGFDSGPLWMSEAVKWFAEHLPQGAVLAATAAPGSAGRGDAGRG
jgi:hypothetical protein